MKLRAGAVAVLLMVVVCAPGRGVESAAPCLLGEEDRVWLQRLLDAWAEVNAEVLGRDSGPLPWIVLLGTECVWELNARATQNGAVEQDSGLRFRGRSTRLTGRAHEGHVTLPNGTSKATHPQAFTALAKDGRPFFLVASLATWRTDPGAAADPRLADRILGAALHELVHTLQLETTTRAIEELESSSTLPEQIDDDFVETRFGNVPGFAEAFRAERDAFEAAFFAATVEQARALAEHGLELADHRRRRFYGTATSPYARLEDLFLDLEGLAEWVRFRFARRNAPDAVTDRELLEWQRGRRAAWSQDEGLVLMLALERLAPGTAKQLLADEQPSLFTLLRAACRSAPHASQ